jgi:hypothetical protein
MWQPNRPTAAASLALIVPMAGFLAAAAAAPSQLTDGFHGKNVPDGFEFQSQTWSW